MGTYVLEIQFFYEWDPSIPFSAYINGVSIETRFKLKISDMKARILRVTCFLPMMIHAFGYLDPKQVLNLTNLRTYTVNEMTYMISKVRKQLERCLENTLEPVRLCNYACEIRHDMCSICKPVMTRLEEKCYSNLFNADFFWS